MFLLESRAPRGFGNVAVWGNQYSTLMGIGNTGSVSGNLFTTLTSNQSQLRLSGNQYSTININNLNVIGNNCQYTRLFGSGNRVEMQGCNESSIQLHGSTAVVEASNITLVGLTASDCTAKVSDLVHSTVTAGANSEVVARKCNHLTINGPAEGTVYVKGVNHHSVRPSAKVFDGRAMNYLKLPRRVSSYFVISGRVAFINGIMTTSIGSGGGDVSNISITSTEGVTTVDYIRSLEIDGDDDNNVKYKVGVFNVIVSRINEDIQEVKLNEADFVPNSLEVKLNLPSEVILTGQSRDGGATESMGIWGAAIQNVLQEAGTTTITINNNGE